MARSSKSKSKSRSFEGSLLSATYRDRLQQAFVLFTVWVQTLTIPYQTLTSHLIDAFLVDYIQHLFELERPLGLATHTVLAAQHFRPKWKGKPIAFDWSLDAQRRALALCELLWPGTTGSIPFYGS